MPRVLKIAALSLLAALPQALGGYLHAYNSCKFKIWCSGAKNGGFFTEVSEVPPGTWYRSDLEATGDVGAVLKCALNPYNREPFQIELNVDNTGVSWLDISAIDGDPFLQYHRHAEIPGTLSKDVLISGFPSRNAFSTARLIARNANGPKRLNATPRTTSLLPRAKELSG
ncbi:hypothetical protein GGR58DRAFT_499307 [Xylaria digitata]|nr:hypothetical protein GGR58DRAFT_499307 [Xylaria digitata]